MSGVHRSVHPSVWGSSAWMLLHWVAAKKPGVLSALIGSLKELLPCPRCRKNLETHLASMLHIAETDPGMWVYELHNRVNGKGANQGPSLDDVIALYSVHSLEYADVIKFLLAIVESHPGGNAITKAYLDASIVFWGIISGIFKHKRPSRDVLYSRPALRSYLHEMKKKFRCSEDKVVTQCTNDICII